MNIHVSEHAFKRIRQRVDKTCHPPTLAYLAMKHGLSYPHFRLWLKKYVRAQNKKNGKAYYKLYKDRLFLYHPARYNPSLWVLITVMPLHFAVTKGLSRGYMKDKTFY